MSVIGGMTLIPLMLVMQGVPPAAVIPATMLLFSVAAVFWHF